MQAPEQSRSFEDIQTGTLPTELVLTPANRAIIWHMYESIFPRSRAALIVAIFGEGRGEFAVRQLVRVAGGSSAGVQRLLREMQRDRLIRSRRVGNAKLIRADTESPLFDVFTELARKLARPSKAAAPAAFFERFQQAARRRELRASRVLTPAQAQAGAALRFGRVQVWDLSFSSFSE